MGIILTPMLVSKTDIRAEGATGSILARRSGGLAMISFHLMYHKSIRYENPLDVPREDMDAIKICPHS